MRAVYTPLRAYAAVVGALSDDPDDLVQEAIARTLRITSLAEIDNPLAYLRRAVTNLVINHARSDHTDETRLRIIGGSGEVEDAYPSELSILELIPPAERAAVYLADVEGRPFDEVAHMLGCTAVAARLRASRGRRRLRRALETLEEQT